MDKEKAGNRSEKKGYIYILELTEDVRRDGIWRRAPLTTREGNQQRACGVRRRAETERV